MRNIEIAEYLVTKIENCEGAVVFFRDFGIDIDIEKVKSEFYTKTVYTYNHKQFYEYIYENFDAIFIQNLLNMVESEKIAEVILAVQEMQGVQSTKNSKKNNKNNKNNTTNTPTPVATTPIKTTSSNLDSIATLSQLTTQVSQHPTMTAEAKTEILHIIYRLEDSRDNNDKSNYLEYFFTLLEKLQGSGLVSEWVAKSAKFIR